MKSSIIAKLLFAVWLLVATTHSVLTETWWAAYSLGFVIVFWIVVLVQSAEGKKE